MYLLFFVARSTTTLLEFGIWESLKGDLKELSKGFWKSEPVFVAKALAD